MDVLSMITFFLLRVAISTEPERSGSDSIFNSITLFRVVAVSQKERISRLVIQKASFILKKRNQAFIQWQKKDNRSI
jgi:hypothetical protein